MSVNTKWLLALLPFALSVLDGCGTGRPQFVDTLDSPTDQTGAQFTPDLRFYAPTVVAAAILDDKVVAHDQPAVRAPEILLDLHEVRCRKEADIRSAVPADFTFYYFTQSPNSLTNNQRYKLMPKIETGHRYVLFLASERGQFRSVGDVGQHYIEIYSGRHPRFQQSVPIAVFDRKLGIAIADLLLATGEGANREALAQHLTDQTILVGAWGSRLHNFDLISKLLAEPEPVRSAACFVLAEYYWGHDDCLSLILKDPNVPQDVHDHALQLSDRKSREAEWLAGFKASKGLIFPGGRAPDSRQAWWDELQILLRSSNARWRTPACVAVRRYFPGETCTPAAVK